MKPVFGYALEPDLEPSKTHRYIQVDIVLVMHIAPSVEHEGLEVRYFSSPASS